MSVLHTITSYVHLDQGMCEVEPASLHADFTTAYWYKTSLHQCCTKTLVAVRPCEWSAVQLRACSVVERHHASCLLVDPTLLQMTTLLVTIHCP